MSTISRRGRSRVAVFAVVAVLASLLALPLPAGAATAACPDTIPSAGFTDMAGYSTAAQDAVDCVAFYDVTAGIGGGLYGPAQDVTRSQMAIFLWKVLVAGGYTIDTTAFGFTDISGESATAQAAINAIANAGVTAGVGGGLYDPAGKVPRWHMALFLAATLEELGVTLDTTAFGFTDIAVAGTVGGDAINAVANAGVSVGIGGGLFDPLSNVTRVQMALFLAAELNAAGVVAPTGAFVITPGGDQMVDPGDSIVLTVTNPVASTTHSLGLFPSANLDGDVFDDLPAPGNGIADDLGNTSAEIVAINGVDTAGVQYAEAAPANGVITVEIEAIAADFTTVVLVVWADDGDNQLDLTSADKPAEVFGASGAIQLLPDEAPNGYNDCCVEIIFIDTAAGYLIGDDGGDVYTFFFDGGDSFAYDEDNFFISLSQFEDWATKGDYFDAYTDSVGSYSRTAASGFDLYYDEPNAPTGVSASVGDYDADAGTNDANDIQVSWTAATGASMGAGDHSEYVIELYEDDAVSTNDCEDGAFVDSVTRAYNKTSGVFEDVADDEYCAVVYATSNTDSDSDYSDSADATVDTGETSAPEIDDLDLTTDAATVGLLGAGDVVTFGFSEAMTADLDTADGNLTYFRVTDANSVYQVACVDDATCVLGDGPTSTDADDQLVVTLSGITFISGTEDGIDLADTPTVSFVSNTWDDVAGNQLNLAGSADKTID